MSPSSGPWRAVEKLLPARGGTETELRPTEVTTIRDNTGRDITNAVAEANPATDVDFALIGGARISLSSRVYVNAQYRRQRVVEPIHAVGGEVSTDTNELHLMVGFRVTHPKENNNYHYVELGVSVVPFSERFNAGRGTWNDRGGSGAGFTLQGGVVVEAHRLIIFVA